MPTKSSNVSVGRTRRRRYRRRKGRISTRSLNRKVNSLYKKVIKTQELKERNVTISESVDTTGTVISNLTTLSQGADKDNRNGSRVFPRAMYANFAIAGADTTNQIRIIFFRWQDDDTPGVSTILHDSDVNSFYNTDHAGKFNILFDKLYAVTTSGSQLVLEKFYIKLKQAITWNASDGKEMGHIYMLLISDSSAATHPTVSGHFRLRYVDG